MSSKLVYGVGTYERGEFSSRKGGKMSKSYVIWSGMLARCYGDNEKKNPSYLGCTVCDEWLNFQTFAKWYEENYYSLPNERVHLDKDILFKGNKVYSPETCILVPHTVNMLLTKSNKTRGEFPIGVYKKNNKFIAQCNINGFKTHLGYYCTYQEAFEAYRIFKEKVFLETILSYEKAIPTKIFLKLFDALKNYKINMED